MFLARASGDGSSGSSKKQIGVCPERSTFRMFQIWT